MDYNKNYHPEFGGYVYQPNVPQITKWVEPFVTEKEAQAFIKGCQMMLDDKVAELENKRLREAVQRIYDNCSDTDLIIDIAAEALKGGEG